MVTAHVPEPEKQPFDLVIEKVEPVVRTVIAGHEVGAVRRIVLYCIVLVALGIAPVFGTIAAVPGLIAVALLYGTDAL